LTALFKQKIDTVVIGNSDDIIAKDVVDSISQYMNQEIENNFAKQIKKGTRENKLLEISNEFLSLILNDIDAAWNLLGQNLMEKESFILGDILENTFGQEQVASKGYIKLHIYIYYSPGWFWGNLSTSLLTVGIVAIGVSMIGWGTAAAGIVGLVAGAIIGATLGVMIERSVNNLVNRNGKGDFDFDLINETLLDSWIYPFKTKIEKNLLDFIFDLINYAGGNFLGGAMSTRPSNLSNFGYSCA